MSNNAQKLGLPVDKAEALRRCVAEGEVHIAIRATPEHIAAALLLVKIMEMDLQRVVLVLVDGSLSMNQAVMVFRRTLVRLDRGMEDIDICYVREPISVETPNIFDAPVVMDVCDFRREWPDTLSWNERFSAAETFVVWMATARPLTSMMRKIPFEYLKKSTFLLWLSEEWGDYYNDYWMRQTVPVLNACVWGSDAAWKHAALGSRTWFKTLERLLRGFEDTVRLRNDSWLNMMRIKKRVEWNDGGSFANLVRLKTMGERCSRGAPQMGCDEVIKSVALCALYAHAGSVETDEQTRELVVQSSDFRAVVQPCVHAWLCKSSERPRDVRVVCVAKEEGPTDDGHSVRWEDGFGPVDVFDEMLDIATEAVECVDDDSE